MSVKLVDDWKNFYKWFSTWLIALAAAAPVAYAQLPAIQAIIPAPLYLKIQAALTLLIFFGRVISQKPDDLPPDK